MNTVRMLQIKLNKYDDEQVAIALMLIPSIRTQADLFREGNALVLATNCSDEQIAKARKQYRRQQAQKEQTA